MGNKESSGGGGGEVVANNFKSISSKLGSGQASVKELIERAKRTGVLNLDKMGLKELPPQLLELAWQLRTLQASHNKLTLLPNFIGSFTCLKQLTLDNNRLEALPTEIGVLEKLEALSLNNNELTDLPSSIGNLSRLKTLSVNHNRLTRITPCLCDLAHVDSIDLSSNQITQWPTHTQLTNLKAVELNLNQNRLDHLSDALAQCSRLKVLRVEENCLGVSAFTAPILVESNLSLIAYDGNLFQAKEFHHLDGYDQYMHKYTATKKKMF